jgi:large subunit ribosomal protein L25
MSEVLNVEVRNTRGKRHARRMRRTGHVPGVLYGHGNEAVSLAISGEQVASMVRHGSRLVELNGGVSEKAFVSELQWDAFGIEVLHIDLIRVNEDEKITLEVAIELRGEAPGTREGGVIDHVVHQVEIECPVGVIPEKLSLSVKDLHLNGSLTAANLPLPAGASLLVDDDLVIVTCHIVSEDGETVTSESAEPEVIGRKAAEDEEADE